MAEAPIEINDALLNLCEDLILSNQCGTRCARLFGCFGVWWADNTDAKVRLNRVRESKAVADDGTVFKCAEANVHFVFGRGWLTPDFECANVAIVVVSVVDPSSAIALER